jgi:hypothetical protein
MVYVLVDDNLQVAKRGGQRGGDRGRDNKLMRELVRMLRRSMLNKQKAQARVRAADRQAGEPTEVPKHQAGSVTKENKTMYVCVETTSSM